MIGGPPRRFGHNTFETKLTEIKGIDKRVDHPNRIVLVDVLVK